MSDGEVWITGIGATTPLGDYYAAIGENLLAGRSATRLIHEQHGEELVSCIGTAVDVVPVPQEENEEEFAKLDKLRRMASWCSFEALRDAGLTADARRPLRIGAALGLANEWYRHWEHDRMQGGKLIEDVGHDGETLVDFLRKRLGLNGPTVSVGAACASANFAFAQGRRWIRQGLVDACIVGSCEVVSPITRANFMNLRALSKRFDDAEHAARPFDKGRDGFVMGEGAALFVLESAEAMRRRGGRAYAAVAGFGAGSDASHMIIPSEDPRSAASAMQAALNDAGVGSESVDYVNAHATGTIVGDRAESRALRIILGDHVAETHISSTKSMTGHLISAAAAIEAIACIAAIQNQAVPPTINLDDPDPECDLRHVPNCAISRSVELTMSNSFGFGGSNTTLVLKRAA